MTQANPFDDFMNELGADSTPSDPSCENVHPIVDEYLSLLTEDLMKIDREDMAEALLKRLSPGEAQMIECMTQEIMHIFGAQISDSEEDALDLILGVGDDEELDDDKAVLFEGPKPQPKNFAEDEFDEDWTEEDEQLAEVIASNDDDELDGTPLLMPLFGLEAMIRRALAIGYLTMPDIASHL